jgi:hypothetical protein
MRSVAGSGVPNGGSRHPSAEKMNSAKFTGEIVRSWANET